MKTLFNYATVIFFFAYLNTNAQTSNCPIPSAQAHLNINNVDASLYINSLWTNDSTSGYSVPQGSKIPNLSAGSLWIGGFDSIGQLRMSAQTNRQNGSDFFPGPLNANGQIADSTCGIFDKMWKVNKSTIDSFKNLFTQGSVTLQASQVPPSILNWPATGSIYNPIAGLRDMAPFYDADGNGIYDPTTGDYPLILGDQAVWWVFNDMGNTHTQSGGLPVGVEVHVMAYAYKGGSWDCLNNTTFYQYTIYFRKNSPLDSAFIGFFADPDVGCSTDDYIGCDSTRNLGIAYNASAFDGGNPSSCTSNYGNQPPIIGVVMYPEIDMSGMTKFSYYNNNYSNISGNPQKASDYFAYLSGTWEDKTPWTYGGTGYGGTRRTNCLFTGNPSNPNEWSMCSANIPGNDVRMVLSSGEYNIHPGDIKRFTIGVTCYIPPVGTYPCPDLSEFDKQIDCMQEMFDSNFVAAGIPKIDRIASETITVFPNPATDNVTMSFSDNQPKQITLYNMLGVEVKQYSNVQGNSLLIKRDDLASGIYFYIISTKYNGIQTGKLIFQ